MTSPEVIFTICRRTTSSPYYILKSLLSLSLRLTTGRRYIKEARTRTGKKCCEQQLRRVNKALSRAGGIPEGSWICLRPATNAAPLMCRTKLNTVRLWSGFGATADSDGVLASDLIREGHGKQFSMRKYAFWIHLNSVQIEKLWLISRC